MAQPKYAFMERKVNIKIFITNGEKIYGVGDVTQNYEAYTFLKFNYKKYVRFMIINSYNINAL